MLDYRGSTEFVILLEAEVYYSQQCRVRNYSKEVGGGGGGGIPHVL